MTPLANHVLQSTLFAGLIALLTLAFRRNRARARHALWMAASVKFLIPFSLLVSFGSHMALRRAATAPPPQLTFVMSEPNRPAAQAAPAPVASITSPHRHDWTLDTALAIWMCGIAAISIRWRRRWRKLAEAVHRAAPFSALARARVAENLTILSSPAALEPGVFGIFRPVLLLPAGIERRLSAEQLQAVLAHELCHLRRRDNLAAAIHMGVEALFWFHPLVWWIGGRLVEERELACDEEVLQLGADRETYAASILEVCEFYVKSPLACVSGITGPDLKARIENIMTSRLPQPLRAGKKALLALLGVCAAGGPLAIGLSHPPPMRAQSLPRTAPPMSFDVAAVKVSDRPWLQIAPQRSGGRISWTTDLHYLIGYAFQIGDWRLLGPVQGSERIYEIEATTVPSAAEDQVRLMFQSLLANRFHMESHRVTKEVEGWALTVGKNGPKIKAAADGDQPAPLPEWFAKNRVPPGELEGKVVASLPVAGMVAITGRRVTMPQLASALERQLNIFVVDDTGLLGKYYFAFEYARENSAADSDAPPVFAAIQEDLGLRLQKRKMPVEMLVVDRIDKMPTAN